MLRTSVAVAALTLLALALGAAFAHVLELPNKMRLAGDAWLTVQSHLYVGWGNILGPIELGALAACIGLMILCRADRTALICGFLAASGVALSLVIWIVFVWPSNVTVDHMAASGLSEEWRLVRDRWEYGHAARAALFFLSFVSLALAAQQPTYRER